MKKSTCAALAMIAVAATLSITSAPTSAKGDPMPTNQRLAGRLVDASTRQPIAGAPVRAYSYATREHFLARTDANGQFAFTRLTGDEFNLQVGRSSRHCGGMVRVLGVDNSPIGAIVSLDDFNTFRATDLGAIAAFRYGSPPCS